MSQQQSTTSPHTERPSNTPSKLVPRPAASGDFNQLTNRQPPPKSQPLVLSTITEPSNLGEILRNPHQEKSGVRAGTSNGKSARPTITVTEASVSTMSTERGTQLRPSAQQPRPSHPPSPETLSIREADRICDDLARKVKVAQLGKMYDRVVEADRRGLVDDALYDMVLDFFYRFLPMVFAGGESDPIIINRRQILDHQRVWQIFGPRGEGLSRKDRGKNRPHPWYTRPKDRKMSLKDVVGEVVDSIPRVQIVPGPGKRRKDE
ncbi:hypothetical protein BKA64DRAFT_648922 [Cadophora sp. MPI-SDFR-AT-0126]|nr:hypothetical protein BKA64DRAFT_648922 [Leotiomycetes sp. MPI-SDFR-AT-0126]